jgi:hypothetical protein
MMHGQKNIKKHVSLFGGCRSLWNEWSLRIYDVTAIKRPIHCGSSSWYYLWLTEFLS